MYSPNLEEQLIKTATASPNIPQEIDRLETLPNDDAKKNRKSKNVYTNLIDNFNEHYKARNKHNRIMKLCFFGLAFACLIAALVLCFYIVIKMLSADTFTWEHLTGIIGALATFLTSLLVLPKMIGEYLYPNNNSKDEDQAILAFIQDMRHTDSTEYQKSMRLNSEVELQKKVEKEVVFTGIQTELLSSETKVEENIEKKSS